MVLPPTEITVSIEGLLLLISPQVCTTHITKYILMPCTNTLFEYTVMTRAQREG